MFGTGGGARQGDVIVEVDGEAERVEAGAQVAGAGGDANGDGVHKGGTVGRVAIEGNGKVDLKNDEGIGNLPSVKTLTVDDYQRVRLPDVAPRTKFAYEKDAHGRITLTQLEPAQEREAKVLFVKRNGRTVGVTDRPISLEAIRQALTEFP